jgi:hypothetical protein
VAAIVVYLASNIPRSVALPVSELNEKCVARQGEDMLSIESLAVAAGDLVLSYDGGANQIADVRLDRATFAAASAKMFLVKGAPSGAVHISYTTGAPGSVSSTKAGDTCRTTIQIRLAEGCSALGALKLYQTKPARGNGSSWCSTRAPRPWMLRSTRTPRPMEQRTCPAARRC